MNKNTKITVSVVVGILLVAVVVLSTQSNLFQGKIFQGKPANQTGRPDLARLFLHKNLVVSLVTSPVSSVVPSNVTSAGGTTKVPSVVTTPVTSGVPVDKSTEKQVDTKKLQSLTAKTLESTAKSDFKANPDKFTLPVAEKDRLINLYKTKNNIK